MKSESEKKRTSAARLVSALTEAYTAPDNTDPDGMYTGVPAADGTAAVPAGHGFSRRGYAGTHCASPIAEPDPAVPGGKVYGSADTVSRLIAMQSDPSAPVQDADDL